MSQGVGLIVSDSIKVLTQNGECRIDLCLGDITKLKKEDKVDVIVVSAFRGSYVASYSSVIGALLHNLDISVDELSKDKEEDLRTLYSCWWSRPLPSRVPYQRLLCFETKGKKGGRPQELVANVFRCLVPILNNEDGTVITPLLNTGDQGYGEVSMLKGMVEAAVNWMKAGLPLRVMKLVLYAEVVDGQLKKHSMRKFDEVLHKFAELKERYEMQLLLPKAVPLEFDVYLSFSEEDSAIAKLIQEKLSEAKNDIRIFVSSKQAINKDNVFQTDMYDVMMKSARVITVLSPHYLKDKACTEQYNIALCCNRRAHRDMLAPIYVNSVEVMPTYMGLVQYVDCRVQNSVFDNTRERDASKIAEACKQLTGSLTVTLHTELRVADFKPLHYDVFLSYSHRDTEKANRFVETLQKLAPDLKLFFDVQELKAGKSWQRTLYHSIDGSRCMLALISAPYIQSAVCQEEFALAQAKHFSKGKQHLQLVPIVLEDLEDIPREFSHIPLIKGTPDVFEATVQSVCPAVVQWVKGETVDKSETLTAIFDEEKIEAVSVDDEMEAFRLAQFKKEFGTEDSLVNPDNPFPPPLHQVLKDQTSTQQVTSATGYDITFSYHSDNKRYVDIIAKLLMKAIPQLRIKTSGSDEGEQLTALEKSDCIVPVLSPQYFESPECVEEFHIALWRQRISDPSRPTLYPIQIHGLPQKPTYVHLVKCELNTSDPLWAQLTGEYTVGLPPVMKDIGSSDLRVSSSDAIALFLAAYKLLQRFSKTRGSDSTKDHPPKPALLNVMKLREHTKQINQPDYTDNVCKNLLDLSV